MLCDESIITSISTDSFQFNSNRLSKFGFVSLFNVMNDTNGLLICEKAPVGTVSDAKLLRQ